MNTTRGMVAVVVSVALAALASNASAQSCPTGTSGETVDAGEVAQRLAYINGVLDDEQRKASWWNWGWGLGFGALAATQGTIALVSDDTETQRAFGANAVRTSIAAINQVVVPLRIPELEAADASCEALAAAEAALAEASRNERKQTALFVPRVGSLVLNFGVGAFLLAYGQTRDALIATASGLLVSEIRFQTAPWGAVDAHESYKAGNFSATARTSGPEWVLVPSVAGNASGATLVVRF